MKQRCHERLEALRAEYESGQKLMADLQTKQRNLQHTLLRINGAIQVLEELSTQTNSATAHPMEDAVESVGIDGTEFRSAGQGEVTRD